MFGLPVAAVLDAALLVELVDDEPGGRAGKVPEALVGRLADVAVGVPGGGLTEGADDGGFAEVLGAGLGEPVADGLDVQPASKIADVAAITTIRSQ
ncbi:MAG: hypothetical protein ACR2P2_08345 [Nakamurella sp.]